MHTFPWHKNRLNLSITHWRSKSFAKPLYDTNNKKHYIFCDHWGDKLY